MGADQRTQIHHGLIVIVKPGHGGSRFTHLPERLEDACMSWPSLDAGMTSQNALDVAIENGGSLPES